MALEQDMFRYGEAGDVPAPSSSSPEPAAKGVPLAVLLGAVWLAYTAGRAAGAKQTQPAPTVAGMVASYMGLRSLDAVLGRFAR